MVLLLGVVVLGALMGVRTVAAAPTCGIRGEVIKGPTSPVCREGVPCSGPAGGVTVVAMRSGTRVATTTTTEVGTYRFVLRPGTYVVRMLRSSIGASFAARTVRVTKGRFTTANFEIDTGIR